MKLNRNLLLFIIGMITYSAMAQHADSVIVIYDNQKTIIPVPAFGKQTTIKLADSIQTIEIGVSRRRNGDNPAYQINNSNAIVLGKPKRTTKWFSQVEAGFALGFITKSNYFNLGKDYVYINNNDNFIGYNLGISIIDRERYITQKFTFLSGFKLGFAQFFRKGKTPSSFNSDTLSNIVYGYFYPINRSSFQVLFPVGFSYHFNKGKFPAKINFGNNLVYSAVFFTGNIKYYGRSTYLYDAFNFSLQPYLGMEIGKVGLLFSSNLPFLHRSTLMTYTNMRNSIAVSFTYRLF